MPKSMAYLMHVNWNWIKQRPHFLAEKLSTEYDVDLYFIKNYKNKNTIYNQVPVELKSVRQLTKMPFSSKWKSLQLVEQAINFKALQKLYSEHYDYIWITSPILLQFININRLSNSTIIYDCMDDILAFPQSQQSETYLRVLEEKLLRSADIVIASSTVLRTKMISRGARSDVHIVNNAVSSSLLNVSRNAAIPSIQKKDKQHNRRFFILYIGTVAGWIDFQMIKDLLERHEDVEITLIGPIETSIPEHPRLKAIGAVNHSRLHDYAMTADALIMPFVVNELIEAVDPVKVYEYISFMKPSLIVRYLETMKFDKYVYLYNGFEELSHWLTHIQEDHAPKASNIEIIEFLQQNTWEQRAVEIQKIVEKQASTK
jgi:teichuronic acid biosynthesis glycosyltransferase TuaH